METNKPDAIQNLLAQIPEKTGSRALEALDPDVREILEDFAAWLEESDGKSPATAKAYKSYVATALATMKEPGDWDNLTTDIRSGVNAFVRYSSSLPGSGGLDDVVTLADGIDQDGEDGLED